VFKTGNCPQRPGQRRSDGFEFVAGGADEDREWFTTAG